MGLEEYKRKRSFERTPEPPPKLDPKTFDIHSVPKRLAKLKADPWKGFAKLAQKLPSLT